MVAKKIYRIVSWALLGLTLISILLLLRKPSLPPLEISAEAAKSFDQKVAQLVEPPPGAPPPSREVRITEAELNSKLAESMAASSAPPGAATLESAEIHFEGDHLRATFTVNLKGKDLYLTLGARLAVSNGVVDFIPTQVAMGSLPVPLALVQSTLRDRLNSPEMREHLRLPESIKDVRIENGELVLEGR